MMEMVALLHGLALVLYIASAGVLAGSLAGGRASVPRGVERLVVGAFAVHGAALTAFVLAYGELPLVGLSPSFTTLAFLIALFLLIAAIFREARTLGLVLIPLIALLVGVATVIGVAPTGEPLAFRGAWFHFHVTLGLLGCAGLAVAFASGLVYLLQFRELKGKRFGRVFRFFPSLDTLDRVGRRALAIGFAALTMALVLGWAWTIRFMDSLAIGEPEVIWGMGTWLTFAAVLVARRGGAARCRRGALASVIGFAFVVALYVVLRLSAAGGSLFL